MIVLDASGAVSALFNDGQARRFLAEEVIHAPHLIDVEVLSALRRRASSRSVDPDGALRALNVWKQIGLIRYASMPLVDRAWELRESVTAYDAVYVALAENLGCALVTADARLVGAHGPRCVITVVPD